MNSAAIDSSSSALKALILVNGGAALSLLTFIGSIAEKQGTVASLIAACLNWFAAGVAFGVLALCVAYLTHLSSAAVEGSKVRQWKAPYVDDGLRTEGYAATKFRLHCGAALAGFCSLSSFVIGILQVSRAFEHLS
jgi:hypothetical protein